ncbi:methyltransferase domain-containing protein [Mesorhizobium sp. ORM6]
MARYQAGDATTLPFADRSCDAVVCGYGILHVAGLGTCQLTRAPEEKASILRTVVFEELLSWQQFNSRH